MGFAGATKMTNKGYKHCVVGFKVSYRRVSKCFPVVVAEKEPGNVEFPPQSLLTRHLWYQQGRGRHLAHAHICT